MSALKAVVLAVIGTEVEPYRLFLTFSFCLLLLLLLLLLCLNFLQALWQHRVHWHQQRRH
jgi:hypothetical protein